MHLLLSIRNFVLKLCTNIDDNLESAAPKKFPRFEIDFVDVVILKGN